MNKLDNKICKLILCCLVEDMSVRAKARTADVSKNTVSKLLVDAGKVCTDYQNKIDQKLTKRKFQTDPLPIYIVGLGSFQTMVR